MKLQRIENLNTSLKYIKNKGIKLVGIGAEGLFVFSTLTIIYLQMFLMETSSLFSVSSGL